MKVGQLTLIKETSKVDKLGHRRKFLLMQCQCGNLVETRFDSVKRNRIKSCGCYREKINTTHGLSRTPEYKTWLSMKRRCENIKDISYKNYGGRGITVNPEWAKDFELFLNDMGHKPTPKHSIERIDSDGNYCKENCKWATSSEQRLNQRWSKKQSTKPPSQ